MKKRNLFLSLICSIILTITLVSFTVIGIVSPSKPNNNQGGNNGGNINIGDDVNVPVDINDTADGTAENPYYVYDAETFRNLISEHGTENVYFELYKDIDFAGEDFVPMFTKGTAFNGHIIGKEHTIKNITINITKNNLPEVIYQSAEDQDRYNAHIGIFGNIENAEILNVKFENLLVSVDDEVYAHLNNLADMFAIEEGSSMNEITVGTIAGMAKNSIIVADVDAIVNADAYGIYASDYVQGYNAVGGVVGVAFDTVIASENVNEIATLEEELPEESEEVSEGEDVTTDEGEEIVVAPRRTIKVSFTSENGSHYFLGGVTGYAYDTIISGIDVSVNYSGRYNQVIYVGGISGYARGIEVSDIKVTLSAKEVGERFNTVGVSSIDESKFTWVAGAINVIRANNDEQKSNISNVTVVADVDMDVVFAGAVVEIRSTDTVTNTANNKIYVTISDAIVDANVNTLKAFGLVKYGTHTSLTMGRTEVDTVNEYEFNIRLTGNVRLTENETQFVASLYVIETTKLGTSDVYFTTNPFINVKVVVSSSIYSQVEKIETIRAYKKIVVD